MLLLTQRAEVDAFAQQGLGKTDYDIVEELERPLMTAWAARDERGVTGFLLASRIADELHVIDVVVAERARRRGIGRALVQASMNDATAGGLRLALLEVRRSNVPAIRLYRGMGFVAVRLRPRYYDTGEDAIEMACELAPGALAAFERLADEEIDESVRRPK